MNDQEKVNKNKKVINAYPPFPKIESKDSNIGFAPVSCKNSLNISS